MPIVPERPIRSVKTNDPLVVVDKLNEVIELVNHIAYSLDQIDRTGGEMLALEKYVGTADSSDPESLTCQIKQLQKDVRATALGFGPIAGSLPTFPSNHNHKRHPWGPQ